MDNFLNELKSIGIDVDSTLERFMNNEGLYKKFLLKFPNDNNIDILMEQIKNKDYSVAATTAHTLKGVTGNLGLTPLYEKVTGIVNDLRNGVYDNLEEDCECVVNRYKEFCDVLEKFNLK